MNKGTLYCVGLGLLIIVLFVLNLVMGSIKIPASDVFSILMGDETAKPSWHFIILESRLPQAITAIRAHIIRAAPHIHIFICCVFYNVSN